MDKTINRQYQNRQDLIRILKMDEAFWVATSAPVGDFRCDPKFLSCLAHHLSSVTAADVKEAIRYMLDALQIPHAQSAEKAAVLDFQELNTSRELGQNLLKSGEFIRHELGLADEEHPALTMAQVQGYISDIKKRPLNGDGVLSAAAMALSPVLAGTPLLEDIVAVTGGSPDNDGTTGAILAQCRDFFKMIPAYLQWLDKAAVDDTPESRKLLPFGTETAEINRIYLDNRDRIEHFFAHCDLLVFQAGFPEQKECLAPRKIEVDFNFQEELEKYLSTLPLAPANAKLEFPGSLSEINPYFRKQWLQFRDRILIPLCGVKEHYSREDWIMIQRTMQPYQDYLAANPAPLLDKVPAAHLREYAAAPELQQAFEELVQKDLVVAQILTNALDLEKLLLYKCNLFTFIDNFVFFDHLYSPDIKALFEQGDIQIDARWFHLVLPVANLAAHSAMAQHSQLFIMYLEAEMPDGKKKLFAVPVTNGSKNHLILNKRGVYRDLNHQEHTVRIIKIIANPISIQEALMAPVTKLMQQAEQKIEKWSSQKEKVFQNSLNDNTGKKPAPAPAPKPAAAPPAAPGSQSSMLLSASVAVAALGSAFAFISKTVSGMSLPGILLALVCGFAALAVPLSILAIIKLRRQNLSFLLEGNGWAINPPMKLSLKDRKFFTTFGRKSDGDRNKED